jgi:hypothetical protein
MQGSRRVIGILASIMSLFAAGCAVTHEPDDWLASPEAMQTDTHGGWIDLKYRSAPNKKTALGGELIAIGTDSIYVANETFHSVAISSINSAQLVAYESNAGAMGFMVFAGALSSISNGWFFGITIPMWIIGGGITTSQRSYEPIVEYPGRSMSRFAPYARFPQGLPPGLDRNRITAKQVR